MTLREIQAKCHATAIGKGFNLNEHVKQLLLIGSEVQEAIECIGVNRSHTDPELMFIHDSFGNLMNILEHNRKHRQMDECTTIKSKADLEEELADIIIRVLSYAKEQGFDMQDAVERKMKVNETRPRLHGKEF